MMLDQRGRDTRVLTVLAAVLAIGLALAGAIPRWWWSASGDDDVLGHVEMSYGLRGVHACARHGEGPSWDFCDDHGYADPRPKIVGDQGAVWLWASRVAWWGSLALAVACLIRGAQALARAGSRLVEVVMTFLAIAVVLSAAHLLKEGPGAAAAKLGPGGPLTIAGGLFAIVCARAASRDVMR